LKQYAVLARLFAGVMIIAAWAFTGGPLLGVAYVLTLTALSAARYRIKPYRWLGIAETAVSVGFALFWMSALLGLWFPVLGFIEDKWGERERELLMKDYNDRMQRLKLEDTHKEASARLRDAARIAEITERQRIAQTLHDHAGHEISGALIALQTAQKLYENGDGRAGEILTQTIERLKSASESLRETVHNLKPSQTADISTLDGLCADFGFCETEFKHNGDMSSVNCWELLAANLKEALTNITRHSNATKVNVTLDINADYIRLEVSDNGKIGGKNKGAVKYGLGLSGMRERVRAVNGNMTVSDTDGFKIVCVIPKRGQI